MDHLLVPPTNSKDEEPTPHRASSRARAPLRSEAHASSAPSDELQVACLMGLVSALSATPEVLRVSPYHAPSVVNAVGASVTESATNDISQTPLRKAGIDGSGEVVQVLKNCCIQYYRRLHIILCVNARTVGHVVASCLQQAMLCTVEHIVFLVHDNTTAKYTLSSWDHMNSTDAS